MSEDTTYNGWTNRATWLVNLHLSNDQGTDTEVRELVAQAMHEGMKRARAATNLGDLHEGIMRSVVGDELRDYVEGLLYVDDATDDPASLLGIDLVATVLGEVNWNEVAGHYIEDVREAAGVEEMTCARCGAEVWRSEVDGFLLSTDDTSYYCDGGTHDDPDAAMHTTERASV